MSSKPRKAAAPEDNQRRNPITIVIPVPCEYQEFVPWKDRLTVANRILGDTESCPMACPGDSRRFAYRIGIEGIGLAGSTFATAKVSVWFGPETGISWSSESCPVSMSPKPQRSQNL